MLVKFIEALALAWGIGKSIPLVRVGLCEGSGIPSMLRLIGHELVAAYLVQ
jgi:hypothetical protein